MKKTKTASIKEIPVYDLKNFTHLHRIDEIDSGFGYDHLDKVKHIAGFELYSSVGLVGSVGPLKSAFYRFSITVSGSLDMQIGLEHYQHQPQTLSFTSPNQIFSKNNISAGTSGYYILLDADFLAELIPPVKLAEEFPFFDINGTPVFRVSDDEIAIIIDLIKKMDFELKQHKPGCEKAVTMYLYLALLEATRAYRRQRIDSKPTDRQDSLMLVTRFRKNVGAHYLTKQQVADYAGLLAVSPNHLNRVVKQVTGLTASDTIKSMLLQEAKSLLRYTNNSIAEIAYKLDFSDPASFNRFFKRYSRETPKIYRSMHN